MVPNASITSQKTSSLSRIWPVESVTDTPKAAKASDVAADSLAIFVVSFFMLPVIVSTLVSMNCEAYSHFIRSSAATPVVSDIVRIVSA